MNNSIELDVDILKKHIENAHTRIGLLHEIINLQRKTINYNSWGTLFLACAFCISQFGKYLS